MYDRDVVFNLERGAREGSRGDNVVRGTARKAATGCAGRRAGGEGVRCQFALFVYFFLFRVLNSDSVRWKL